MNLSSAEWEILISAWQTCISVYVRTLRIHFLAYFGPSIEPPRSLESITGPLQTAVCWYRFIREMENSLHHLISLVSNELSISQIINDKYTFFYNSLTSTSPIDDWKFHRNHTRRIGDPSPGLVNKFRSIRVKALHHSLTLVSNELPISQSICDKYILSYNSLIQGITNWWLRIATLLQQAYRWSFQ